MEWALIAGIIGAIVGGVTGLTGYVLDNNEALRDLQDEKNMLYDAHQDAQEKMKLEWQEEVQNMERQTAQMDEQADLTDQMTDLTENILSMNFNDEIDNMQNQQQMYGLNTNAEMMSSGMSEGSGLAQLSASGVRAGSSMDDAIALQSAVNSAQLDANVKYQNSQFDYQLNNLLNGLAQNNADIYSSRYAADQTRDDADYTRSLYAEGGIKQKQYQLAKDTENRRYEYNKGQLAKQIADRRSVWKNFLRGGGILLSGGTAGFNSGYKFGSTIDNYYNKGDN